MKKISTLLILSLISCLSYAQRIIIANNNPGAPGGVNVYFNLQQAIDTANPGDIIHVIPSVVEHDDVVINKSLTILGVGFNPDKTIGTRSEIANISLEGAGSSNTRISGVIVSQDIHLGTSDDTYTISNIIIENSRIGRVQQPRNGFLVSTPISNLILRNNILDNNGSTSDTRCVDLKGTLANVIVTNNVIISFCCSNNAVSGTGLTFENNLFMGIGNGNTFGPVRNCIFRKNIFYGTTFQIPDDANNYTGNVFDQNLAFGYTGSNGDTQFLGGINGNDATGNIVNQDPLFTNFTPSSSWDDSYDLTLEATSPAILVAADRTRDIGPSGGAIPFNPEGTLLPLIEDITAPSVIRKGDDLEVRIRAAGN